MAVAVAGALVTLEGRILEVLVYDSSAPNAVTSAMALGLAGQVVHLASNDQLDFLTCTACPGRARSATLLVFTIAAIEFLAAWSLISILWYTETAIGVGIRNFGLGVATSAIIRVLSDTQLYLVAPLLWLFPAILPGTGLVGEIFGIALRPAQPTLDVWLGAWLGMLAIVLLSFQADLRSRRG